MGKLLDELDHPIVFVFFLALALAGATSIMTWGAKAAGLPGVANAIRN